MKEQKVITHARNIFLRRGPYVRDMYNILKSLEESYAVEAAKVRVLGSSRSFFDSKIRLFRNEDNLRQHYNNDNNREYTPTVQKHIDDLLKTAEMAYNLFIANGKQPPTIHYIELLDKEDREGSYIKFQDREGLVKGRIDYVHREFTTHEALINIVEVGFGVACASLFTGLGVSKAAEAAKQESTLPIPYLLIGFGGLVGIATCIDAIRRGSSSLKNCLETTITAVNDSKEAVEKVKTLADMLREKYC